MAIESLIEDAVLETGISGTFCQFYWIGGSTNIATPSDFTEHIVPFSQYSHNNSGILLTKFLAHFLKSIVGLCNHDCHCQHCCLCSALLATVLVQFSSKINHGLLQLHLKFSIKILNDF